MAGPDGDQCCPRCKVVNETVVTETDGEITFLCKECGLAMVATSDCYGKETLTTMDEIWGSGELFFDEQGKEQGMSEFEKE